MRVIGVVLAVTLLSIACTDESPVTQQVEVTPQVVVEVDVPAQIEAAIIEDLLRALQSATVESLTLSRRLAAVERALLGVPTPNVGDGWRGVRDASTPEMRRAVEVYAACRTREWSTPGGDPVDAERTDSVGTLARQIAAGLQEVVWRDVAAGRLANSPAAIVRLIDRSRPNPHCAIEGIYGP